MEGTPTQGLDLPPQSHLNKAMTCLRSHTSARPRPASARPRPASAVTPTQCSASSILNTFSLKTIYVSQLGIAKFLPLHARSTPTGTAPNGARDSDVAPQKGVRTAGSVCSQCALPTSTGTAPNRARDRDVAPHQGLRTPGSVAVVTASRINVAHSIKIEILIIQSILQ